MKIFLLLLFVMMGLHTVSFGVSLAKQKQKKGAVGAFLLVFFTLGVIVFTFYIGRS